jgi:hypothetical protein
MARSHGLVVKGDDLQSRDCGFESRRRKLDGCKRCYSYYIIKKIKVAKWWTPKKKIFSKTERKKDRKKVPNDHDFHCLKQNETCNNNSDNNELRTVVQMKAR